MPTWVTYGVDTTFIYQSKDEFTIQQVDPFYFVAVKDEH